MWLADVMRSENTWCRQLTIDDAHLASLIFEHMGYINGMGYYNGNINGLGFCAHSVRKIRPTTVDHDSKKPDFGTRTPRGFDSYDCYRSLMKKGRLVSICPKSNKRQAFHRFFSCGGEKASQGCRFWCYECKIWCYECKIWLDQRRAEIFYQLELPKSQAFFL